MQYNWQFESEQTEEHEKLHGNYKHSKIIFLKDHNQICKTTFKH